MLLLAVPPPVFADELSGELPKSVRDILDEGGTDLSDAVRWRFSDLCDTVGAWAAEGLQPALHLAAQSAGYLLLAGLLAMSLAACQEKEPPVSGGDLTDEPGKVRIFNEGGDQVRSSVARYVRVDGELYTDTGEIITLARCGVMDGEITKTVAETELPGEDDCSNFGTGYQYQIAGVYSIDVVIDGDWCRFQREVPSCSYAEEASALGLVMAADPTAVTIQTEGFICTGEEAAPDVETAIQLAWTECEDYDVADAAYDATAGMWRIHMTGEGKDATVWINTDGITQRIVYGTANMCGYPRAEA